MFKWPRTYVHFSGLFSYLFNQIAEEPLNSGLVIIKEGGCIKTTSFFFIIELLFPQIKQISNFTSYDRKT